MTEFLEDVEQVLETDWTPDSYVGPSLSAGDVYLWGGIGTNRPGSWALNVQTSFEF